MFVVLDVVWHSESQIMEYWIRAGNNYVPFGVQLEPNRMKFSPVTPDPTRAKILSFLFVPNRNNFVFLRWKYWKNWSFRSIWRWSWLPLKGRISVEKTFGTAAVRHCCDRMFAILLKLRVFLVRKCFGRFNWSTFCYGIARAQEKLCAHKQCPTESATREKNRCRCRDLQTHQFRVHECTRQRWIRNQISALGLELNHSGCAATENRIQFPLRRRKFNRYVNEMTKTCGDKNNKITEAGKSFRSLINACSRLSFCSTLHTKRQVWFYCAENCTRWRANLVLMCGHTDQHHTNDEPANELEQTAKWLSDIVLH